MCARPRGPIVAHCMTIFSATKPRTSSADISIWLRRDGKLLSSLQNRPARLVRLEHDGVARLLENLAGEPLVRRVRALEDHGAVGELGGTGMVLAHPARSLWGDPDARRAARLDLPGREPAVHVGLDSWARLEALVEHIHLAHAVEPVRARRLLAEVPAVDVPTLLAVHELVRLDRPLGELVLVLLVVVDLHKLAAHDRAGHHAGHIGVIALRRRDLKAVRGRILAERVHDLLARRGERAPGEVL